MGFLGQSNIFAAGLTIGAKNSAAPNSIQFPSISNNNSVATIVEGGATFNGVFDNVLYVGNNSKGDGTSLDATLPANFFQLESDYYDGVNRGAEWNYTVNSTAGGFSIRPFAMYTDNNQSSAANTISYLSIAIGNKSGSKFEVANADRSQQWLTINNSGLFQVYRDFYLMRTDADQTITASGTRNIRLATDVTTIHVIGSALGLNPWQGLHIGGTYLLVNGTLMKANNDFQVGGNVGFYNTTPVVKPTVTGSRGGNAALASLLTALASQGLVTDSSSA